MSPFLKLIRNAPFGVDVVVGMRTEAEPCSLGRSGVGYSNQRRSDPALRNPGLHVLVAPLPRVGLPRLFSPQPPVLQALGVESISALVLVFP